MFILPIIGFENLAIKRFHKPHAFQNMEKETQHTCEKRGVPNPNFISSKGIKQ